MIDPDGWDTLKSKISLLESPNKELLKNISGDIYIFKTLRNLCVGRNWKFHGSRQHVDILPSRKPFPLYPVQDVS